LVVAAALSIAPVMAAAYAWGVGMRDGKLVVVIDASGSPANMVVDTASFNATFIDGQGRTLGKKNIGLPVREIESGKRIYWTFDQPYPAAVRVSTDALLTAWHAGGLKNDGEEVGSSESINPSRLGRGITVPPPAPLGDRCAVYGRRAVEQNQRNQALACGYADSRWSSDANYHSAWCRTAPDAEAERETVTRDTMLRQCLRTKVLSTVVK
jgi:hypothetical protein